MLSSSRARSLLGDQREAFCSFIFEYPVALNTCSKNLCWFTISYLSHTKRQIRRPCPVPPFFRWGNQKHPFRLKPGNQSEIFEHTGFFCCATVQSRKITKVALLISYLFSVRNSEKAHSFSTQEEDQRNSCPSHHLSCFARIEGRA